jgi:hypothetical protein
MISFIVKNKRECLDGWIVHFAENLDYCKK